MNFSAAAAWRLAKLSPFIAAGLMAGGCMSSPTYGTGVTSNEQLVDDVTSIVSLAPKRKDPIDYKPRPELVKPASGQASVLPPPQDQVASAGNPDWPESPEQRRQRIRKTVDANRDSRTFESPVVNDEVASNEVVAKPNTGFSGDWADSGGRSNLSKEDTKEVQRRIAASRQGNATQRRYLSEPPLDYRQPAATAAADDLGEDELKKERRAKKAATVKGGIRDYIPWL